MVRLGEKNKCDHELQEVCFNSTMVRLGAPMQVKRNVLLAVSIPPWYDWENKWNHRMETYIQVSIPPWYDWEYI